MELQKLQKQLFNTKKKVYSVIDGAALPALLGKLEDHKGESTCLFRGELPFDLAEAAPYLVSLKKDDAFTLWLLKESLENTCCIFAHSDKKFIKIRKYFRSLMKVEDPEGKRLLFRFYDPTVLRTFLPVATPKNNKELFDKIETYLMLSEEFEELLSFKKPQVNQNKEDYKKNIEAATTLNALEIEEAEEIEQEEDLDKTVLIKRPMVKLQEKENKAKIPSEQKAPIHPAISSENEEIDLDKTVFMPRKPNK